MFNDRVELEDLQKLPDEYREVLVHQLSANGEGELSAGDCYIDSFYPLSPDADERFLCAKFAMEELDHYRRFARLLMDMGIDLGYVVHQAKSERKFFPAESMTVKFTSWEERGAFSFLCELEGHYQIKEMVSSTYAPLARMAPTILKEEAGHFAHGMHLMSLAAKSEDSKARAQAAIDRFYIFALDMFGYSHSRRSEAAVRWGLRKHTNGELRDLYKVEIARHINKLGFRVPQDAVAQRKYA
jgi:ring-1,2-phenylacetyl-CoA epoxidase subunit PaaA